MSLVKTELIFPTPVWINELDYNCTDIMSFVEELTNSSESVVHSNYGGFQSSGFTNDNLPNMENLKEETENMMDMLKNMTQMTQNPEESTEQEKEKGSNPFGGGLINDIAKEFNRANKLINKKKKAEAYKKAYLSLTTLTGLPAPTINRFIENYSEIGKDGDIGKDIARILNFSDYAKDGPGNKKRKFYRVKYKF